MGVEGWVRETSVCTSVKCKERRGLEGRGGEREGDSKYFSVRLSQRV